MKVLGIETSCDETAIAVVEINNNREFTRKKIPPRTYAGKNTDIKVLSNIVASQVKLHAKYGGVVPNLAAREHEKNLPRVFKLALSKSKTDITDVGLIAATRGPGLAPSLWRGVNFAKELAEKYNKSLIGVNHLEGHIYSNWLKPTRKFSTFSPRLRRVGADNFQFSKRIFPILNLIVSGGHTELVLMTSYGKYKLIGETLDDAVGEAFDKVARLLKLGYPGGPAIAQRAMEFKVKSLKLKVIEEFPKPMINSKDYNFSYSGLKTAVLYKIRNLEKYGIKITSNVVNEICHEFQKAAIEVLLVKTIKAAKGYQVHPVKSIFLSGGVSANKYLRKELEKLAKENEFNYRQPEIEYTGDNAAMIAITGYFNYHNNKKTKEVKVNANLNF